MSTGQTLVLGAIAGGTIFLGLPVGRMRASREVTALLTAVAVGVLAFLLVDVLSHAAEPTQAALDAAVNHGGPLLPAIALPTLFAGGLAVGLLALVGYDAWRRRHPARSPRLSPGPGAAAATDLAFSGPALARSLPAERLALLVAVGIGLHNFAEGLAIGQSAAAGKASLAALLVVGFALHNATEGFGIVAPMTAAEARRPSWGRLTLLGLIGGGPTFLGTAVGQAWVSTYLSVAFLTLAAGSILYVVVELLAVLRRMASRERVAAGLLLGLLLGFATDFLLGVLGG